MKSLLDTPSSAIIDENVPGIYEPQYVYRENRLTEGILDDRDIAIWKGLVDKGMQNAFRGLSELLHHQISLNTLEVEQVPVNDVLLLSSMSDTPGIGIYLSINNFINGQLMLIFTPKVAYQIVDIMLELPLGSTKVLGDIEWYALKDIGNITGSYFLNALADFAELILMPSPPEVIVDSVSSIMKIPMQSIIMNRKNAILVKASFISDDKEMEGTFIALPTDDMIKTITNRFVGC